MELISSNEQPSAQLKKAPYTSSHSLYKELLNRLNKNEVAVPIGPEIFPRMFMWYILPQQFMQASNVALTFIEKAAAEWG